MAIVAQERLPGSGSGGGAIAHEVAFAHNRRGKILKALSGVNESQGR
jgi:hypothetical protein